MAITTQGRLRAAIAIGSLLASAVLIWFAWIAPMLKDTSGVEFGRGVYNLQGSDGQPFTEQTLKNGPTAVFFGFTHCPDVCPTTLADIALWQDELGPAADDLRFYFVTVDPERDTVDMLGDYVGWVDGVVGVSGSVAEIEKAKQSFRIFARKVPLSDGEYTMDHSAYVMLFDQRGEFFEPIGYQEDLTRVMAKLNRLLQG